MMKKVYILGQQILSLFKPYLTFALETWFSNRIFSSPHNFEVNLG